MTHEDDGTGDAYPYELRPRKVATIETTLGKYFRLVIDNLKEHEANEMIDILRARGYLS